MNNSLRIAKRCIVIGRVQGVFFRQATYQKANSLELKGWVRNLDNGNVECYVCGDGEAVEALCAWLWQGPPTSKVKEVQIADAPLETHSEFVILR